MIALAMHEQALAAWCPPSTPAAARARFIRHHLHHIRVQSELVFTDDPAKQVQLDDIPLVDVPVGCYELHVGGGKLSQLTVTFTGIFIDAVLIIETPDRRYHYVPAGHLHRLAMTLEGSDLTVWVLCRRDMKIPAMGRVLNGHLLDYAVTEQAPTPHGGMKVLGKLDLSTGAVVPKREVARAHVPR